MQAIISHTEENCPNYNHDSLHSLTESLRKKEKFAEECGIKLYFLLSAEPEHHFFALMDARKVYSVNKFLKEVMPITSSFKIVPVQTTEDLLSVWQKMEK